MRSSASIEQLAVWTGRIGILGLIVVVWVLAAGATDSVAPLGATFSALADGFDNGTLVDPTLNSLQAACEGFVLATIVGVAIGFGLGRSLHARTVFEPLVAGLLAVPRIIIYPVLLTIFGVTISAKVAMAGLAAVFPIIITTTAAVRAVNPVLLKVGHSVGGNEWQLARKIYLPATAATMMSGVRLAFSIAFINVVIAEFFTAASGLGLLASHYYNLQQLPQMFAVVLVIFVIAFAGNLLLWGIEGALRRRAGHR